LPISTNPTVSLRQRRREEDFLRTVANYRSTVATLKQEKKALLDLQQGGEGEKSSLIAASQNALARAAQLVSDAEQMRRREAKALFVQIDQQMYRHLSHRLEGLLPQSVVAPEVSSLKGELMACKLVSTASRTLEGLAASFSDAIRPPTSTETDSSATSISLSDEVRQKVVSMIYQAEFAQLIVEMGSEFIRLLAAGQWPDLLAPDGSIELGAILGHSTSELDVMLGGVLKSFKEEGGLIPEQSNAGALRQLFQITIAGVRSDIEREEHTLLPASWTPPGWELLRDASQAKFSCLSAAAAMSSVLHADNFVCPPALGALYSNIEQAASQASTVSLRLANLDVQNNRLVKELSTLVKEWKETSVDLTTRVQGLILSDGEVKDGDVKLCESEVANILEALAKLSSAIRSAKLNPKEDDSFHALSPEAHDTWGSIASLSRAIRAIDGDEEDVNHLIRARAIEQHLGDAVDNEPKLEVANTKITQLEKVRPRSHCFLSCLILGQGFSPFFTCLL
jgi:dynactin 1